METAIDTFPSLFWGYTALWAILALYIVSLSLRLSKLEQRNLDSQKNS